jgi:hypothetical protein
MAWASRQARAPAAAAAGPPGRGRGDRGDQVRPFGVEPRECSGVVAEIRRREPFGRGRRRQPQHVRVREPGGGLDRVQVPVEQPADRSGGRRAVVLSG